MNPFPENIFSFYRTGYLILLVMMPALFVDALNGWLIREAPSAISVSQVYRIGLLLVLLLWLAKYSRIGFQIVLAIASILSLGIAYHSLYFESASWAVLDFHFGLRLVMHFIFYLFLFNLIKRIRNQPNRLEKITQLTRLTFKLSYAVIAANILLGITGIGYSTVPGFAAAEGEAGFGGLGFFKAGNDVSATFVVVAGVQMYFVWKERNLKTYIFFGVLTLILAVLLQTKVSILGILILFIGVPLVYAKLIRNLSIRKKPAILLLIGVVFIASVLAWLIANDAGIVRKFMYFLEDKGLLFAIMTGRDYFLELAIRLMDTQFGVWNWVFGMGWSHYLDQMGGLYGSEKLVEIDYVDILMINGLVGLGLTVLMWATYLINAYRAARISDIGRAVLLIDLMLLGLAGTSGHVFYSTMNSMFIALLNILPMLYRTRTTDEPAKLIA